MSGEFDFISWIRAQQCAGGAVRIAAGDDLAVLKWESQDLLLVGCDQVLDKVHFDSSVHTPHQIGRKVMNRNLSDCAAMACLPAAAVATVALPRGTSMDYAKELYLGMKQAADVFACPIIGGDTAAWDGKLVVTVSILGRSAGITPLTRAGAMPGNGIFVTGPLGGSLSRRHIEFAPRVNEARLLAQTGLLTAMIDLSDGLSRDLAHLCQQSHVGAVLDAAAIPIHPDALEMPPGRRTPLEHALHDGEDHELLFTAPGIPCPTQPMQLYRIGTITDQAGIFIQNNGIRSPLQAQGWEHTF